MTACGASPSSRLAAIKQRGHVVCGVAPGIEGFAAVDSQGRYSGFDVDICRALSAAIFGDPGQVRYVQTSSVDDLLNSRQIDVVSRRLTASLTREGLGLLFGPVTFFDGQGFLVSKELHAAGVRQLSGTPICVDAGTLFESTLASYFAANSLALHKILIPSHGEIAGALAGGRCQAYTADVSELGAIRSRLSNRSDFEILPDQISKEPLAQVVRQEDIDLYEIVRWTVFAMIQAEELGISSANVDEMPGSRDQDVKRLLGTTPGNGRALGLNERWAYDVIKGVGNYGEVFERNVGAKSPIGLDRGLNKLWTSGGLIYALPLR